LDHPTGSKTMHLEVLGPSAPWNVKVATPPPGMSLRLLKFSGGSVDDYAICRSS
jgi:hypothetical protein